MAIFLVAAIGVVSISARPARADDRTEARAHYDKATTAYALGRYADAAGEFEQAFALKADPALLYNAAQAYRLAGRRDRALELYRNYLRVFGRRAEHAADVEWHIGELEKLAKGNATTTTPVEHASLTVAPPPPSMSATAQSLSATLAPTSLVSTTAPPPAEAPRPIYERWWFWAGAGAIVVSAVVVGVVLANRRSTDCGAGVDYCANTGL